MLRTRDPARGARALRKAGWLDRDGDGVADKERRSFEIELLSDAGNAISRAFAAKLQKDLKAIGIALRYTALDSKAVDERKEARLRRGRARVGARLRDRSRAGVALEVGARRREGLELRRLRGRALRRADRSGTEELDPEARRDLARSTRASTSSSRTSSATARRASSA